MSERITEKDVRGIFEKATQVLESAGVKPPSGMTWCLNRSMSHYSLTWRDEVDGTIQSAALLPRELGSTAREAWNALYYIMWTARSVTAA